MVNGINKIALVACILAFTALQGCVGPDFTPDYYGLKSQNKEPATDTSEKPADTEKEKTKITAVKVVIGKDGKQTEIPIPSEHVLEVSSGTFIAKDETNIGSRFSASAKFKITNSGSGPVTMAIPSTLGAFFISSNENLSMTLNPKQSIILTIDFRPTTSTVSVGGKISEKMKLGDNEFHVVGVALESSGLASINVIDSGGKQIMTDASVITFGEIQLAAQSKRSFFRCDTVTCNGDKRFTKCLPCIDMLGGSCELLTINKDGKPVDEVTSECKPATADTDAVSEINIGSTDFDIKKVDKRIIEIVNRGTEQLLINDITVTDLSKTKSKAQFEVNKNAIFLADSFEEIEKKVLDNFNAGKSSDTTEFPVVLPPYDPPNLKTKLYVVVSYNPNDVVGANGLEAAVGSATKDEAMLNIVAEGGTKQVSLVGSTTIREIPSLQVYVKTSTGVRPIANGDTLPFKNITVDTKDLALPLFMKLSDSAAASLKITSTRVDGTNFEWLDTKEKISGKAEGTRCTIPIYDTKGSQIDMISDLNPVSLNPSGYTLVPGAYNLDNMPLFGCINFHRDETELETVQFKADMTITANEVSAAGTVATNPDGTTKETTFTFALLGVIDPLTGRLVFRMTQTMAGVLNPLFPGISAIASKDEMDMMIKEGLAKEADRRVFIMAMDLDPFDEETITGKDGNVITTPNDGITAVFQPIDTRAVPVTYDDPTLWDYTTLLHDSLLPEGQRGSFEGYPNLPADFRTSALKVFTASLSYPGPTASAEERPNSETECEVVDPCSAEGLRKLGQGNNDPKYKGVCAYFYITAGSSDSSSLNYSTEEAGGTRREMCVDRDKPYAVKPIKGKYSLDGKMEFENVGMLFQGPTYFHNPYSPLGSEARALDEKFAMTFTTEMLLPISDTKVDNRLPDKRIDIAKGEYKINLNDSSSELPLLCKNNMKNRFLGGKYYSTWGYIAPLLWKDKEGTIPAGCPEANNSFTGGIAYISGKKVDQKTGHATFVTAGKFSSSEGLTFAFKDVMLFLILNGWFCDPAGDPAQMEGEKCFDKTFNYRDAITQFSIITK